MKFYSCIIYALFITVLLSCSKEDKTDNTTTDPPEVSFNISYGVDGATTFSNTSKNAESYEWDFGDGSAKNTTTSPTYTYLKPGKYNVTLKAAGKGGSISKSQEADIKISQKDLADIDKLVSDLMTKYDLPGAQLAISKGEKMVYAKSYGLADKVKNEKMNNQHLLRIASCSKPYAGIAIMKLVEQGKLQLNSKVFGPGGVLGTKYGTKTYSSKVTSITVSQLLLNTTGFFVDAQGIQTINLQPQMNDTQFMNWLMDNSSFAADPGTLYYYNNNNFFVSSIVVENVTGMTYENFIKKEIFDLIGDKSSRMGKNNLRSGEATYYGQGNLVNNVYNFDLERYKGAGANISTAINLLKFALAIDGNSAKKDLLPQNLLNQFYTVTPLFNSWAHGVSVWPNAPLKFMYGSLPGTRSGWMFNQSNGLAVSIIFNGNLDYSRGSSYYQPFEFAVQDLLVNFVSQNRTFQSIDQFAWE